MLNYLKIRFELKKVLDKILRTRYNECIKNGIDTKSNLIHLDRKKEMELKKVLDRLVSL